MVSKRLTSVYIADMDLDKGNIHPSKSVAYRNTGMRESPRIDDYCLGTISAGYVYAINYSPFPIGLEMCECNG